MDKLGEKTSHVRLQKEEKSRNSESGKMKILKKKGKMFLFIKMTCSCRSFTSIQPLRLLQIPSGIHSVILYICLYFSWKVKILSDSTHVKATC